HSFKQIDLKGPVPFMAILLIIAGFVFIAISPSLILFGMSTIYAISGPILTLLTLRRHRASRQSGDNSNTEA
ncbi:MAG: CDP-diacylglycerol--serine O-phosphatidyltransferase, partial [Gammaproteobacteria bacterium]